MVQELNAGWLCAHCGATVQAGHKCDAAKLRYDLIPGEAEEGLARVLTYGAAKYQPRNWEAGMDWHRPYAALRRHMAAWWNGEDFDPESGLHHLEHVLACASFLLAYQRRGIGTDDRPKARA